MLRVFSSFLERGPSCSLLLRRWATNLGGSNTQNGRDSISKRLGVKLGHGSSAMVNQIIVRQRGYQYYPGGGVKVGKDHTLHAAVIGKVCFSRDHDSKRTYVNVIPSKPTRLPSSRHNGFTLQNVAKLISPSSPFAP